MLKIEAVQTTADYTDALTVGPDNFTTISLEIWNASAAVQVFQLSSHGHHQTGEWSDELILSPSTFTFTRCGGIRVRTNPKTGTPAVINAWAVKAADPTIVAGAQNQGTLTPSSGSFSPPVTTFPYATYVPVFRNQGGGPSTVSLGAGAVEGWFAQIGGGLVHTFGIAQFNTPGTNQGVSENFKVSLPILPIAQPWDTTPLAYPNNPGFVPGAGIVNLLQTYGSNFVIASPQIFFDNNVNEYGWFEAWYTKPSDFPTLHIAGTNEPWAWGADGDGLTWNFVYQGITT